MSETPATLAQAREEFLGLVASLRPELHRYCARLTGSVIEGEDIVQDTLAKAFYAMSQMVEVPPLRPWLFRIAKSQRRGKEVGVYFGNYAKSDVRLRVVRLEGKFALAAHLGTAEAPSHFILLAFEGGKVTAIRDYRYVPYIALEAEITA
jgi:hypothetical protein